MKKQLTLILFLILFLVENAKAQSYSDAFTVNIGAVQDGIGGLIAYNYFLNRHDFIDAGVLLTAANFKYVDGIKIPYNDFTLNLGYSKNVFWNYKNTFNINVGGGALFGYETVNKGDKNLSNGALILSKPGFIYGAYITADFEYSISDVLSVSLKANQYYHANSSLGDFVPFVGLGARIYIN